MPAHFQSVIDRASKKIAKDVLSAQGSVLAHVVFFSPTFLAKLVGLILNVFFDGPCSFDMHQTWYMCFSPDYCVELQKKEIEGWGNCSGWGDDEMRRWGGRRFAWAKNLRPFGEIPRLRRISAVPGNLSLRKDLNSWKSLLILSEDCS